MSKMDYSQFTFPQLEQFIRRKSKDINIDIDLKVINNISNPMLNMLQSIELVIYRVLLIIV